MASLAEKEEFHATTPIDDPDILDVVLLVDGDGKVLEVGTGAAGGETVSAVRRSTTAARLEADLRVSRWGALDRYLLIGTNAKSGFS